jgi:heptaprenyl diphosphate synthase
MKAGGKRMRPAFALLAAKLFQEDLTRVRPLAVALEMVHLASLIHDDVVDNSMLRRGIETVKSKWGNRVSIYSGNYILSRSLQILADYRRSDIIDIMAQASIKISEGELIQLRSLYDVELGIKNYFRRIERKTALLISVSCQLGAMIAEADPKQVAALKAYGYYLGMAFQITDDILDLIADEKTLGKPTGSDIKQGVITLPAIYALHHSEYKEELTFLLSSPISCNNETKRILDLIMTSDGIEYAYYVAGHFARKAQRQLQHLPQGEVLGSLYGMAEYMLLRDN